ncbi:ArsR/SmtB family transcription factor [Nocardioides aequoreus]|uniref:ArsR/SmtB family transcription factor n=1 Tax=Nocardioides aequoreus TaxID=397278 RepID=UPI0004C31B80|nr:metalloregulator ArsR/SmtB family transcription factor [Nocardioides aequoreus]
MTQTVWAALADPHRRDVLDLLAAEELSVGELVTRLSLTQPQTSKHLRVLRDAGLVRVRQRGQHRIYAVEPESLSELDSWLATYRRLWSRHLDRLGEHLEQTPQGDS